MPCSASGASACFRSAISTLNLVYESPHPGFVPVQGGEITLPPPESVFYLSQRPYLVAGSLRDQLLYPGVPAAVWAEASPAARARFAALRGPGVAETGKAGDAEQEALLEAALEALGLSYLLDR